MLTFDGSVLTAAHGGIFRRWRLVDGALQAVSLRDPRSGREWITAAAVPGMAAPRGCGVGPWTAAWTTAVAAPPWAGPAECGRLDVVGADGRGWRLHVTLPADAPAVTCRLELLGAGGVAAVGGGEVGQAAATTGIETDGVPQGDLPVTDLCERLALATRHCDLVAVDLLDQSDGRGTPVQERRWRLYPAERIAATAGIIAVEATTGGAGLVIVRHAPPPHARGWHAGPDVIAWRGEVCLRGHGCGGTAQGWAWTVLLYDGGAHGRAAAMHAWARARRRRVPEREGRMITNTWGDRNRDGRINEGFLVAEVAAAAALGADAMQIDAGWQQGVDANSVANTDGKGVWNGYWAADPQFWDVHPKRLPNGLGPVFAAAARAGIDVGMWFAPDSSQDFAQWRRDAQLLARYPAAHWKFDSVKLHSRSGELRFDDLLAELWRASGGRAWLDLDITAEARPGFLGAEPVGCLFVQNRYTDWGNWWPHETLRTLWELAWWVPPQMLRVEFLNPARNPGKYADDPLAPGHYLRDDLGGESARVVRGEQPAAGIRGGGVGVGAGVEGGTRDPARRHHCAGGDAAVGGVDLRVLRRGRRGPASAAVPRAAR
jgi:alpha-galactosidase